MRLLLERMVFKDPEQLLAVLLRQQQEPAVVVQAARALRCGSPAGRQKADAALVACALQGALAHRRAPAQPAAPAAQLAALTVTLDPLQRAALQRLLLLAAAAPLKAVAPKLAPMAQEDLRARYRWLSGYDLPSTLRAYETARRIPHRPGRGRGPFTYQWAFREPAPPPPKGKPDARRDVRNGEVLRRRYITLPDAAAALAFFEEWHASQRAAAPQAMVTLLECGTYDGAWRKWILDIDASHDDLCAAGFSTDPAVLLPGVLDLAEAIGASLHRLGFLHRPCPFAVVSRHVPGRKCSWHVTLCALADHERWRRALEAVERAETLTGQRWGMLRFVDGAIRRNTKSQYMQVWGSTKVAAGEPCNARCFRCEGVWATATEPLLFFGASGASGADDEGAENSNNREQVIFAAATSLMLHDPWSLPFVGLTALSEIDPDELVLKAEPPPPRGKKRGASQIAAFGDGEAEGSDNTTTKRRTGLGSEVWSALPPEAAWMRRVICDGRTRLETAFSDNPAYQPYPVRDPRAVVWLHAHVRHPACCARRLVAEGVAYQHSSNTALLYCFADAHGQPRMLVRCFASSCRATPTHVRINPASCWVEVVESDRPRAPLAVPSAPSAPKAPKAPTAPGAAPKAPRVKLEAPPAAPQAPDDVWAALPRQTVASRWIHEAWAGAALTPAPVPADLPPLAQRAGITLVVCAAGATLPFCPHTVLRERVRRPHPGPGEVLVFAQRSPSCVACSYRLFVRAAPSSSRLLDPPPTNAPPQAAQAPQAPQAPQWVELTRLALLVPSTE